MKEMDIKVIRLGEHKFFESLITPWGQFAGCDKNKLMTIVAVRGAYDDWGAYYESFESGSNPVRVKEVGCKMPREVAEFFFPDLAKERTYRD